MFRADIFWIIDMENKVDEAYNPISGIARVVSLNAQTIHIRGRRSVPLYGK